MAARKRGEGRWGERVIGGIGTAGTARPTEATAAAPCEDIATGSWPGRGTASSPRAWTAPEALTFTVPAIDTSPRESKTSGYVPEALKVSLEPIAIELKSKTASSCPGVSE